MNKLLQEAPKKFCDNTLAGFTPEYFIAALFSGKDAYVFSLTPQLMKRVVQQLQYNVDKYEEKHGLIDTKWEPGVKSPLQIDEVDKGK